MASFTNVTNAPVASSEADEVLLRVTESTRIFTIPPAGLCVQFWEGRISQSPFTHPGRFSPRESTSSLISGLSVSTNR